MGQAPVPSLVYENRVLKGLLETVGFDKVSLEGYLQGVGHDRLPESVDSGSAVDSAAVPSSDMQFMGLEPGLPFVHSSGLSHSLERGSNRDPYQSSDTRSYDLNQLGPVSTTDLGLSRVIADPFDSLGGDFSHPDPESTEMIPNVIQSQVVSGTGFAITEDLAGIIHNFGGENHTATN